MTFGTLRQCFNDCNHSSDKWEKYFEVYERHLSKFVDREFNLVEVGVQKGGSLEMWSRYFCRWTDYIDLPHKITGIDIDQECSNLKYDDPNIRVVIGDQGKDEFWDEFIKDNSKIDIFIDDGGHFMDQQISTFEKVFPVLSIGGVYICEDVHTSYMAYNGGGLFNRNSFIEYIKPVVDLINKDWWEETNPKMAMFHELAKGVSSIHFYDSMVVIEKSGNKEMKRVRPTKFNGT